MLKNGLKELKLNMTEIMTQINMANCKCEEASLLSRDAYIPCGAPATHLLWSAKDKRAYCMCSMCADHNIRRDMIVVGVSHEMAK